MQLVGTNRKIELTDLVERDQVIPLELVESFRKARTTNKIWDFHHGVYETAKAAESAGLPIPTFVIPLLERWMEELLTETRDMGIYPSSKIEIFENLQNIADHIHALEESDDPSEQVNICYTDLSMSGTEGDWLEFRKINSSNDGRYSAKIRTAKKRNIGRILVYIAENARNHYGIFYGLNGEECQKYFEVAEQFSQELGVDIGSQHRRALSRIVKNYECSLEQHKASLKAQYGANAPAGLNIDTMKLPKNHGKIKTAAERYLAQDVSIVEPKLLFK